MNFPVNSLLIDPRRQNAPTKKASRDEWVVIGKSGRDAASISKTDRAKPLILGHNS